MKEGNAWYVIKDDQKKKYEPLRSRGEVTGPDFFVCLPLLVGNVT